MPLIDATYFDGNLILPNITVDPALAQATAAIAIYEPEYLRKVMGQSLYVAFTAAFAVTGDAFDSGFDAGFGNGSPDDRWLWIRDGHTFTYNYATYYWPGLINVLKQSPIACYVYWQIRAMNATQTTGVGETIAKAENSTVISPARKMVDAWRQMVDWNRTLGIMVKQLTDSDGKIIYPEFNWEETDTDVYHYQNVFGI